MPVFIGDVKEVHWHVETSVVKQDIEAAGGLDECIERRDHLGANTHIGAQRQRCEALCRELIACRLRRDGITIENTDRGTLTSHAIDKGAAHATACASDDDRLAIDPA